HFIPAYNLPVYASQRPLPDATQDSVRGCSLGFAAAVISDGRLQRAYKAQPAQIRTGPIRAYGSHLGCLTAKRLSGHGWRIRGFAPRSVQTRSAGSSPNEATVQTPVTAYASRRGSDGRRSRARSRQ